MFLWTVQAVCVLSVVAMTSTQEPQASGEIGQLALRLTQAKNASDVFSLFAEHVEQLFGGLIHLSILLLPTPDAANKQQNSTATASTSTGAASSSKPSKPSATAKDHAAGSSKQQIKRQNASDSGMETAAWELVEKLVAFQAGSTLDWTNCCLFNLFKHRGPVVQATPAWPLSCTAAYYAGCVVQDSVHSSDYCSKGPHFLDWKGLHDKGAVSFAAVPMFSCNQPVAVLCLASTEPDIFERKLELLRVLSSVLAPYVQLLEYTTRRMEMQRLVNEIITPIAAQLAQQKQSQLSRLGCSVEEEVAPAKEKASSAASSSTEKTSKRKGGDCKQRHSVRISSNASQNTTSKQREPSWQFHGQFNGINNLKDRTISVKVGTSKRQEPAIGKHHAFEVDQYGPPPDMDLDWGDFFFNLVSMCIVYVYFSKAAVAGESLVAILLCMGVAAFDIVLLVMRWLWFEHYVNYGSFLLHIFQIYRVVVLPIANTWMSWSLLNKMEVNPHYSIVLLLGILLMVFIILGVQVRFFLHAPLQLASVLFAATSTSDICGLFFESTSGLSCIGIISALQLTLGLVLPTVMVYILEARAGRSFLPHVQAKRWLLHP